MNNRIIKAQENIFDDLGFEPDEAANLKIRADLILDLQNSNFKKRGGYYENNILKNIIFNNCNGHFVNTYFLLK